MTRALLLAAGPWRGEPNARTFGPTIRARQFAGPMLDAGVELSVVLLEDAPRPRAAVPGARRAMALDPSRVLRPEAIWRGKGPPPFDAVLGVGSLMPAAAAARFGARFGIPAWVDLFGDPLAEWHAEATASGHADRVQKDHVWKLQREALLLGDAFSVVSQPQASALLGMLLLLGRVDGAAAPHRRIHRIPVAAPEAWSTGDPPPRPEALAGEGPIVAVTGTWTPWLDGAATGEALAALLDAAPAARVAVLAAGESPGGASARAAFDAALGRHDCRVLRLAPAACPEEALLAHASALLLVDRDLPETRLGARNRLLAAARWGTAVVSTPFSETAREMAAAGLAEVGLTTAERASALQRAVAEAPQARAARRRRGRAWLKTQGFAQTLQPVLEWLRAPGVWAAAATEGSLQAGWASLPPEPGRIFGA